ncbi:MAG: BACON domain-containing protein [Acidobacteriota bacterium]|nr:BACON domain-containing protein [Acidobacteriota bacterium]
MRRLWLFGLIVPVVIAACSGSPSSPTPTTPPAATCAFTVSSTALSVAGVGGTASISVTTGSICSWTVVSSGAFVNVTSPTSQTGPGNVTISVAENTGDARTATLTVGGQTVTVNQSSGDPVFGNWAGSISKGAGCPAILPATVAWNGTIRRTAAGSPELVISLPSVGVVNQTVNLILSTNALQFAVFVDSVYTFTATLAADRRSLTGTFTGGSCSGTWTGARQ